MDQSALFSQPATRSFTLSQLTSREAAGDKPVTWRKLNRKVDCDECLANQHETAGACGPRSPGRITRTVNGASLYLCWIHAELWKARDRGE